MQYGAPPSPVQSFWRPVHRLVHAPSMQLLSGFEHTVPQLPQLALSLLRFAQYGVPASAPHVVWFTSQTPWQMPLTQSWPLEQALPQVPQLLRSVLRFAQYGAPASPPQSVCPLLLSPHVPLHAPPKQTCPAAQTLPHAPQFSLSVLVLTQLEGPPSLPHSVLPEGQAEVQTPPTHAWPPAQRVPHLPQFSLSVLSETQMAPQASCPVSHWRRS